MFSRVSVCSPGNRYLWSHVFSDPRSLPWEIDIHGGGVVSGIPAHLVVATEAGGTHPTRILSCYKCKQNNRGTFNC